MDTGQDLRPIRDAFTARAVMIAQATQAGAQAARAGTPAPRFQTVGAWERAFTRGYWRQALAAVALGGLLGSVAPRPATPVEPDTPAWLCVAYGGWLWCRP
jgi:hypothetical protein